MDLLATRRGRTTLFTALYFSEGAPIGLVWWALPTLLRVENVEISQITGLTATLVLPWALKFLWAPLVDSLRTPRWGFRAWIISAQLMMGLSIAPLIWIDPATNFEWWRLLLILHAVSAATQDVAIDAMAINVVPRAERGALNGSMQAGMLIGRSVFGGGALLAASWMSFDLVLAALIVCIWSSLALVVVSRESASLLPSRYSFNEFLQHLRSVARGKTTWFALGFALVGAAAFESAGLLAGPFLVDHGVSQSTIGLFFGIAAVAATLAGGLIGGKLSDRWGRVRSTARFLVGIVAMVAFIGALDLSSVALSPNVFLLSFTLLYFCIGLFIAASYALFMAISDPRIGGTHFSTFMSATNACESWSGYAGGQIAARAGYGVSFLVLAAISLLSLPLLRRLQTRSDERLQV